MTDEKHPADRVVELFLFAPVGLALSAKELLPQLVERGRQQLSTQVTVARMLGQLAVKQGQVEAEKAFDRAREQAQTTLEQLGVVGDGSGGAPPEPAGAAPTADVAAADPGAAPRDDLATEAPTLVAVPSDAPVGEPVDAPAKGATRAPSPDPVPVGDRPEASGAELAIPDYDSLSASQVLPRLSGLDPAELEAVRAHEAGHRGRKTILHKVAQLQGA